MLNNNSICLWRGALGGVLGNLAKAVIVAAGIFMSSTRFDGSVLLFAVLGMPSAAIIGLIIAIIIRVIARKIRMGIIARAVTGAGLLLALGLIAYFSGVSSWSADEVSTWMVASLFYIDFWADNRSHGRNHGRPARDSKIAVVAATAARFQPVWC